jgi:hypothetical protein
MLPQFKGTDSVPAVNAYQSLTEYLRGHIGFWGTYTGTTNSTGYLTIPHKCGFTPSVAFVQAIYDGSSPHNHYGPISIVSLDETNLTVILLRANGNDDTYSTRTVYYHILPKVTER